MLSVYSCLQRSRFGQEGNLLLPELNLEYSRERDLIRGLVRGLGRRRALGFRDWCLGRGRGLGSGSGRGLGRGLVRVPAEEFAGIRELSYPFQVLCHL